MNNEYVHAQMIIQWFWNTFWSH